jgi:hypothetical protein
VLVDCLHKETHLHQDSFKVVTYSKQIDVPRSLMVLQDFLIQINSGILLQVATELAVLLRHLNKNKVKICLY